jgi:DNA-binding IclR family transcriptional regulator
LSALADRSDGVSAAELAREIGLDKSTTYRLLRSLAVARLVRYDADSMRYRLGGHLVELGLEALDRSEFIAQTRPFLTHLRDLTGETAVFYMRVNDRRAPIFQVAGPARPRIYVASGYLRPLDVGASGNVLVAFETEDWRAGYLERLVQTYGCTGERRQEFAAGLEVTRRHGYAIGHENPSLMPISAAIAFPVFNQVGRLVGSFSVVGVGEDWSEAKMLRLLPECQSIVLEASEVLRKAVPFTD